MRLLNKSNIFGDLKTPAVAARNKLNVTTHHVAHTHKENTTPNSKIGRGRNIAYLRVDFFSFFFYFSINHPIYSLLWGNCLRLTTSSLSIVQTQKTLSHLPPPKTATKNSLHPLSVWSRCDLEKETLHASVSLFGEFLAVLQVITSGKKYIRVNPLIFIV